MTWQDITELADEFYEELVEGVKFGASMAVAMIAFVVVIIGVVGLLVLIGRIVL